jgi:hypothetical protein
MKYKVEFVRMAFEPIGKVCGGEIEVTTVDVKDALSEAWASFNRGSGNDVVFTGPSASVDDIFRVSIVGGHPGIYELHVIAPVGFKRVDRYAESFDLNTDRSVAEGRVR